MNSGKSIRGVKVRTIAAAATALSLLSGTAYAAQQQFTTVLPISGDLNRSATLPLFNPALGDLTQVQYAWSIEVDRSPVTVSHNPGGPYTVVYDSLGADVNIAAPGIVVNELMTNGEVLFIPPGSTSPTRFYPFDLIKNGIIFPGGVFLSEFEGVGTFDWTYSFSPIAEAQPLPTGVTASFAEIQSGGYLQITYDYNPVPVPAAVWLFGSALVGLGAWARRRT